MRGLAIERGREIVQLRRSFDSSKRRSADSAKQTKFEPIVGSVAFVRARSMYFPFRLFLPFFSLRFASWNVAQGPDVVTRERAIDARTTFSARLRSRRCHPGAKTVGNFLRSVARFTRISSIREQIAVVGSIRVNKHGGNVCAFYTNWMLVRFTVYRKRNAVVAT